MTQNTETNVAKEESCSFTPRPNDPGAFKMMATINGEQRNTIRVLRSWRLQSPLAPTAGIRYDGLYVPPKQEKRIETYKLIASDTE